MRLRPTYDLVYVVCPPLCLHHDVVDLLLQLNRRLICLLLRVAAVYRRVLLIDWQSPVPIERFFSPAHIDWRLTDSERDMLTMLPVHRWSFDALDKEPPSDKYLRVVGNAQWFSDIRLPGLNFTAAPEPSLSCLWNLVFSPAPSLQAAMAASRRNMTLALA